MAPTGESGVPRLGVHPDLVDLEVYAVYRAITEVFGDRGWEVVYRSGEILFVELERRLNITETEPLAVARRLTDWLVEMGYARELVVSQPEADRLIYEMDDVVVTEGVYRLLSENPRAVLPHWSTALLMAALQRRCGVRLEMEDTTPERLSPTRSREYWRLRPAGG